MKYVPFKITVIYTIVGGLWFLIADRLITEVLASGLGEVNRLHAFRYWIYLIASAGIIYLLIHHNLKAIRRSKENLQTTQEQLGAFINNSAVSFVVCDLEGSILQVNDAFEKLYGWSSQEVIGMKLPFVPEVSTSDFQRLLQASRWEVEVHEPIRKRKDGSLFFVSETISPIRDAADNVMAFTSISRNITKRMEAERRLEESEQRYKSLIEHNSDAVFSLDLDGKFLSGNPAAEKITGYRTEETLNKSFIPFIVAEDVERTVQHFEESIRGASHNIEIAILHKNGHRVDLNVKTVPIVIYHEIVGIFAIAKDITELKKAEELLRKSEMLSAVGQLAAGVAHEIRNPLTAIKGFVQLLQSTVNGNKEYFDIMLSELERINFIVNEFLYLAKPQVVNYQQKDLSNLLQNIITLLDTQAIMNNVRIILDFEPDIPLIQCDENKLKQVFINILKNAIEAMPNGGDIEIHVKRQDSNKILIRFIDQGCGIPEESIPKLGEPFYTTKEKGTGLGLMVSHKIIAEHQGSMYIQSQVDKGTAIDVILPA